MVYRIERDTSTPMFIAALFTIARTWKQPRCPSADKWIRKLWYIYTMEYYSAIKKSYSLDSFQVHCFVCIKRTTETPDYVILYQAGLILFSLRQRECGADGLNPN